MSESERSRRIRLAAFQRVSDLQRIHPTLRGSLIEEDFNFDGERMKLTLRRQAIFKPRHMTHLLSIKTVFPRKGRLPAYADQKYALRQFFEGEGTVEYNFSG